MHEALSACLIQPLVQHQRLTSSHQSGEPPTCGQCPDGTKILVWKWYVRQVVQTACFAPQLKTVWKMGEQYITTVGQSESMK